MAKRKFINKGNKCSIEGCNSQARRRGWCKSHYGRWYRHGDPLAGIYHGAGKRFIEDLTAADGCIVWPYGKVPDGYGMLKVDGKSVRANRYSLIFHVAPPPTRKHEAAHLCGNRACVNPAHLTWATPSENAAHKLLHGTSGKGELNPRSILTARDVVKIKGDNRFLRVIAQEYGVSIGCVYSIKKRRTWKHLP